MTEALRIASLREALGAATAIEDLATRSLEVVAIVDEAVSTDDGNHLVVVGGMAVYLWTANESFRTVDIDVVYPAPQALGAMLEDLGFIRSRDGRHWELPGTEIFIESPARELDTGVAVKQIRMPSGRTADVLSHVDVLVDRLDEFQATGHQIVGQQCLVLIVALDETERDAAATRATERRVRLALDGLSSIAREIEHGSRGVPESDEWHKLASGFLRAEYHR